MNGTARVLAVSVAALMAGVAAHAASSGRPAVQVSTAALTGEGKVFTFDGTFTLDHFVVRAPQAEGLTAEGSKPRLVAVGTTSVQVFGPPSGGLLFSATDAPLAWVNVTISGSCSAARVSLDSLNGSDYLGLHGEIFFPDLPNPPWASSSHWSATASPIDIRGSSGLLCAVAHVAGHDGSPATLATLLNQLLEQAG